MAQRWMSVDEEVVSSLRTWKKNSRVMWMMFQTKGMDKNPCKWVHRMDLRAKPRSKTPLIEMAKKKIMKWMMSNIDGRLPITLFLVWTGVGGRKSETKLLSIYSWKSLEETKEPIIEPALTPLKYISSFIFPWLFCFKPFQPF